MDKKKRNKRGHAKEAEKNDRLWVKEVIRVR